MQKEKWCRWRDGGYFNHLIAVTTVKKGGWHNRLYTQALMLRTCRPL
jgi:hypothetical protein